MENSLVVLLQNPEYMLNYSLPCSCS